MSPQIQGTTEKRIFENLKKSIYEFMNNTKWTNDVFSADERIKCTMVLTISEKVSTDEYKGNLQIISTRTIYKTNWESPLVQHSDQDVQFRYVEFQPLDFTINQHMSNLTSLLGFWAYVVIATDYDTFSPSGGTLYWQKAQTIVNNAQNAPEKGWKSMESTTNRFWIPDNMLQPLYAPVRECLYKYHRLGFDVMYADVTGGRAIVTEALADLEKVHNQRPLSFPLQMFFNAKRQELIDLFKGSRPDEKAKILPLLQKINPANGLQYQQINQQ